MKIQKTNQTFNGIKIASARAKAKGTVSNYDLYKVTSKDAEFLDELVCHIDLPELWPGLEKYDYCSWLIILNSMINLVKAERMETLLIAKEGVLCGGLNYSKMPQARCDVGYRVTWPVESGKKAPFAGKILYLQLFKKCLEDGVNSIRTVVSLDGPFDTVAKCLQLGFNCRGGDDYNEIMGINSDRMRKAIEYYKPNIEITPVPKELQEDKDLFNSLKI